MKEEIIREIMKECNWWEKIVVKVLGKMFVKVYKTGIKAGFNWNSKTVH